MQDITEQEVCLVCHKNKHSHVQAVWSLQTNNNIMEIINLAKYLALLCDLLFERVILCLCTGYQIEIQNKEVICW